MMTNAQFSALSELLRLRDGPATLGVRLVLVDGLGVVQAARQAGCSRQSVGNALKRCQRGLELVRQANGV
jgi:hypothetical protein